MSTQIRISILFTIITTLIFGIAYPYAVTGAAQVLFPKQANGQLIQRNGTVIGSSIIGQGFTGDIYFHSRPSAAGTGYDAANSGGSNLGPTSKKLIDRISASAADEAKGATGEIPVDLVTTSASGLDPHITPASAEYQVNRIAQARHLAPEVLRGLVAKHTEGRQFGLLGEPRVNVLELNLDLDQSENTKH